MHKIIESDIEEFELCRILLQSYKSLQKEFEKLDLLSDEAFINFERAYI